MIGCKNIIKSVQGDFLPTFKWTFLNSLSDSQQLEDIVVILSWFISLSLLHRSVSDFSEISTWKLSNYKVLIDISIIKDLTNLFPLFSGYRCRRTTMQMILKSMGVRLEKDEMESAAQVKIQILLPSNNYLYNPLTYSVCSVCMN